MADLHAEARRSHHRPAGAALEPAAPLTSPANPILAAQRAVGNQAVQRALGADSRALPLLHRPSTIGNQAVQRLMSGCSARPTDAGRWQRQHAEPSPLQRSPTHHVYEPLSRRPRGWPPIVEGATLRQRIANAEAAGYEIVRQRRLNDETGEWETHTYARIPRHVPLTRQQTLMVNGVSLTVRNASEAEVAAMRTTLALVPGPHLAALAERMRAIVLVDWTGAPDPNQRRLSGGVNIERARDSSTRHHARFPEDDIGEPAGLRIEITHTSMLAGGQGTLLHEVGHVVYNAGLIPRRVNRDNYGASVHTGASGSRPTPTCGSFKGVTSTRVTAPRSRPRSVHRASRCRAGAPPRVAARRPQRSGSPPPARQPSSAVRCRTP